LRQGKRTLPSEEATHAPCAWTRSEFSWGLPNCEQALFAFWNVADTNFLKECDMLTIPNHINAQWIATLADDQLIVAEAKLHAIFHKEEVSEKRRSGGRYKLLQGPAELVNAWHRWTMLSNATRRRGLLTKHPA
jgi:hypothetical protein